MAKKTKSRRKEKRKIYYVSGKDKRNKENHFMTCEINRLKDLEGKRNRLVNRLTKLKVLVEDTDTLKSLRKKLHPFTKQPKLVSDWNKLREKLILAFGVKIANHKTK